MPKPYSVDLRARVIEDVLLRCARPASMHWPQTWLGLPTRFGLSFPPGLLAIADEVIE